MVKLEKGIGEDDEEVLKQWAFPWLLQGKKKGTKAKKAKERVREVFFNNNNNNNNNIALFFNLLDFSRSCYDICKVASPLHFTCLFLRYISSIFQVGHEFGIMHML